MKVIRKNYIQIKSLVDREGYKRKKNVVKYAVKKVKKLREFGEELTETCKISNKKFWTTVKRLKRNEMK